MRVSSQSLLFTVRLSECLACRQLLFDEFHSFETSRLNRLDLERCRRRQILVAKNELSGDSIACQLDEQRSSGSATCIQTVPLDFLLLQDGSDDPLLKSFHLHRLVAA